MSILTREDLQLSMDETQQMIDAMVANKYVSGDERNLEDVIARICRLVAKHGKKFGYTAAQIKKCVNLLRQGYFLPGGSILAGLTDEAKKSSLSNCYVMKLKHDSLEDIFRVMAEMARTYSYRGGCGVDITTLRPEGSAVHNAAKFSSGAVSFMPLISTVTETIGQSGRRGATMISMDVRHPDIMRFIWCKADPARVFSRDFLNKNHSQKVIRDLMGNLFENPDKVSEHTDLISNQILQECDAGKLPSIDGANISIKFTDKFMEAVEADEPWVCEFPDIEADKDLYNCEWDGDYQRWASVGGTLKQFDSYDAIITSANMAHFVGHSIKISGQWVEIQTVDHLNELINSERGLLPYRATVKIPSARQLFHDACKAAWMRGDPGVLFWDRVRGWTTINDNHQLLRMTCTNPCSEIPSYAGGSCLLGAHVISKYIVHPWTDQADFDILKWSENSKTATILMNIFSDINETMHPLEEQRHLEKYAKRVGIEFTALADTLSMLGLDYGKYNDTISFILKIMGIKARNEVITSISLAKQFGPCQYFVEEGKKAIDTLCSSPYFRNLFNKNDIHNPHNADTIKQQIIQAGGLRNVAFNTVGPTGSLSILADNCSSGIEPIFALCYTRQTRVGTKSSYTACHRPVAKMLLATGQSTFDIDQIKKTYHIKEAYEIEYEDRLAVQAACQRYCDSSISSTINLPRDCTADNIFHIYQQAWLTGLKGITVYRDGSLDGILKVKEDKKEKDNGTSETLAEKDPVVVDHACTDPTCTHDEIEDHTLEMERAQLIRKKTNLTVGPEWGDIIEMPRKTLAERHEVYWNGSKMYLVVSMDEHNRPMEIFISSLPRKVSITNDVFNHADYQEKLSLWTALMRTISIGLRAGVDVSMMINQLRKAAFTVNDMMSVVARVLEIYTHTEQTPTSSAWHTTESAEPAAELPQSSLSGSACPQCGSDDMRHEGGCATCHSCGYSKCS